MSTLQQNLQRPFYIKHLLERLRYGKAASAMRAEAAELIEWLVNENTALGLKLDTARMGMDELKKREARWIANFRKDANTLADIADRLWTELDRVEPDNG